MAYFSNGSEGMCFDEQCMEYEYGDSYCPIHYIQVNFNYEACNNKVASDILGHLVKNDGTCEMYETFKKDFKKGPGEQMEMEL